MGYAGQTYRIPLADAGFSGGGNFLNMRPSDLTICRNIDLLADGVETRAGTEKVNGTALSGAPSGRGGFNFVLAGSDFKVFATSDGKLWKTTAATIKTGLSTANYFSFTNFGGTLIVCDGDTTPQTWDGAAGGTSDLATPNGDWSGGNQPFQVITHGRGVSRRAWYLYGTKVYASSLATPGEVTGGTSVNFVIDAVDDFGLVGGVSWGNRLFVFSKRRTFIIDDSSADTADWGWERAQWTGGVAHWRLIVPTPNDLLLMTHDGDIYSVTTVQSYGDYKAASLTRPAFIDRWIRETIDLTAIEKFHGVYDRVQRCVRFWMVRQGQTTCDTCLKFYIDRTPANAWAIDDGIDTSSGFRGACSFEGKESDGTYRIYTVDSIGFQWKLGAASNNDDSAGYTSEIRTAPVLKDNPRIRAHWKRVIAYLRHKGNYNITAETYVNSVLKTSTAIPAGGVLLDFPWTFPVQFAGADILRRRMEIGDYGEYAELDLKTSGANEGFFASELLFDFKPTSALAGAPS